MDLDQLLVELHVRYVCSRFPDITWIEDSGPPPNGAADSVSVSPIIDPLEMWWLKVNGLNAIFISHDEHSPVHWPCVISYKLEGVGWDRSAKHTLIMMIAPGFPLQVRILYQVRILHFHHITDITAFSAPSTLKLRAVSPSPECWEGVEGPGNCINASLAMATYGRPATMWPLTVWHR